MTLRHANCYLLNAKCYFAISMSQGLSINCGHEIQNCVLNRPGCQFLSTVHDPTNSVFLASERLELISRPSCGMHISFPVA